MACLIAMILFLVIAFLTKNFWWAALISGSLWLAYAHFYGEDGTLTRK